MRARDAVQRPRLSILVTFTAWKFYLLSIAVGSTLVGNAYDTSASLALSPLSLDSRSPADGRGVALAAPTFVQVLLTRLNSWDAIYFVSVARRWYQFEQEWAFGSGLPLVIGFLVKGLRSIGVVLGNGDVGDFFPLETLLGVLVANVSHLLSALALYQLSVAIWEDRTRALVAAIAHILSPAGLFLSAPYAESTFSLLSFTGYLLLAHGCRAGPRLPARRDALTLLAGAAFGLATAFRSNGILNGLPLAWEFLHVLASPFMETRPRATKVATLVPTARRLFVLGVSGISVALGYIIPQYVAYRHFCTDASAPPRPWCAGYLPSIYTFVQTHYWVNGFLRYWTVSNIPLFLLAGPMILILIKSGLDLLSSGYPSSLQRKAESSLVTGLIHSAAVVQILLAVLAFTAYNVQIVTRLSSGYPLWYCWLADSLARQDRAGLGKGTLTFMVIYASIQGALFASFLPPA